MEHKLTTLKDGYDVSYYPQTYANVVKRQFIDESVETSLHRLEYFRNGIYDQNAGVPHRLISLDEETGELRSTDIQVVGTIRHITELTMGEFFADSLGNVVINSLTLQAIPNAIGSILTVDNNGQVGYRTPQQVLSDIGASPLDSPKFTGVPTVPTPTIDSSDKQIANVEFVESLVNDVNKHWGFIKLLYDNWTFSKDEHNYHTQRVDMSGMRESYKPIFNLIVSSAGLEAKEKEGFFGLGGIKTYDGYIIARTQELPSVDIILDVKGV